MYNQYYDVGFRVVTLGLDWSSMNCSAWGETFELSFPVLDDSNYGIFPMVTENWTIPHNLVIDHNMNVVYSAGGYDHSSLVNAVAAAIENLP